VWTILLVLGLSLVPIPVHARGGQVLSTTADLDVCLSIDDARDTLSPQDRTSAILLLARQFEIAGRRVVADGCTNRYVLSHIALGDHIFITLTGAGERREGIAAGLDDLPALYSQMVRSIITGRPMSGFNVLDRTNVTAAQSRANRVHTDRYVYARVGYGSVFGERILRTAGMGVGYRAELDSFGIDVSFFNVQSSGSSFGASGGATTVSLVKLQALYFLKPTANASPYVAGGLSWGATGFSAGANPQQRETYSAVWHGSGLQGELAIGYELPRASMLRMFVEGTVVLPFYRVTSQRYSAAGPAGSTVVSRRHAPSVVVSLGLGWQRSRDAS
jgi:hypothetical protein